MKKNTTSPLPSPPEGGEGDKAKATTTVAYHAGPPEIRYFNREWRIGMAQPIPTVDWIAMNDRSDFPEFDFREEP